MNMENLKTTIQDYKANDSLSFVICYARKMRERVEIRCLIDASTETTYSLEEVTPLEWERLKLMSLIAYNCINRTHQL